MKKGLTELVFILDRSGSMGGLEKDTIGGYNAMLNKQKEEDGECRVTTVLFDGRAELLHDRIEMQAVSLMTDKEYFVRGSTALLDAMGTTIHKIDNAIKHTADDFRPENVLFVIITDGEENSSREYSASKIKDLVEQQTKVGWEFIFLGANIDAVETASHIGISADNAQNYHADREGVQLNFKTASEMAASFRRTSRLDKNWKQNIDKDFKSRDKTN